MNPITPEPKTDKLQLQPLTNKNKCRKRKRVEMNGDTIKVGTITIEKRDVTFEFN